MRREIKIGENEFEEQRNGDARFAEWGNLNFITIKAEDRAEAALALLGGITEELLIRTKTAINFELGLGGRDLDDETLEYFIRAMFGIRDDAENE